MAKLVLKNSQEYLDGVFDVCDEYTEDEVLGSIRNGLQEDLWAMHNYIEEHEDDFIDMDSTIHVNTLHRLNDVVRFLDLIISVEFEE